MWCITVKFYCYKTTNQTTEVVLKNSVGKKAKLCTGCFTWVRTALRSFHTIEWGTNHPVVSEKGTQIKSHCIKNELNDNCRTSYSTFNAIYGGRGDTMYSLRTSIPLIKGQYNVVLQAVSYLLFRDFLPKAPLLFSAVKECQDRWHLSSD